MLPAQLSREVSSVQMLLMIIIIMKKVLHINLIVWEHLTRFKKQRARITVLLCLLSNRGRYYRLARAFFECARVSLQVSLTRFSMEHFRKNLVYEQIQ
jgi:hypothetical protein